ncbi:MAG: lysoplasmalogenase family protein [Promethearchaeota archaeon]
MLHLIPYTVIFWIFAFVSTLIKAAREDEITFQKERLSQLPKFLFIVIKFIPALTASIIIVLFRPTISLFYILLAVAFVFCLLGEIGMETKFLVGVGLFLIAQIIFIGNFIWQSLLSGISFLPVVAFITAFLVWMLVIIFLTNYIESAETGLGQMKVPLIIYALTVSLTFCSALTLWLTSGMLFGFIPVIGAFFFVISDFTIGIKEFHHHFNKAEIFISTTYYLAIFLLSLSVAILIF